MRENMGLYRGKRLDNGEWVEGYFNRSWLTNGEIVTEIRDIEAPHFMQMFHEVDPSTVGQYTGLTDKHGKRIFEGDIVESRASGDPEDWKRWTVAFEDGCFCFKAETGSRKPRQYWEELCEDNVEFYGLVVIGNIHDNPELMERGRE